MADDDGKNLVKRFVNALKWPFDIDGSVGNALGYVRVTNSDCDSALASHCAKVRNIRDRDLFEKVVTVDLLLFGVMHCFSPAARTARYWPCGEHAAE